MNIARQGYSGVGRADANFAPLYPYLVLYLKPLFGGGEIVTGLLLSTLMAVAACVIFYRLVWEAFQQDEGLARWSVAAWGIYPTSFFLFAPFTEALFSALALGCLLALYRRQWLWSGLLAVGAGLARQQGVLMVVPMLVFGWQHWCDDPTPHWRRLAGLALAPLGYLGYLYWRSQQGIPFILESYGQFSKAAFLDPFSGYITAWVFALSRQNLAALTEVLSITLFLTMTIWMCFRPRFRADWALLAYNFICLALFVSMQNLAATPIQSSNRYVISLYPAFIGLGALLLGWPPGRRKEYVLASLVGWMAAATLYVLWLFVG